MVSAVPGKNKKGADVLYSSHFPHFSDGDSAGNRTRDPLIKSQLLYHLSYRIIQAPRGSYY